jgi:hypothetical protein
VEPAEPRGILLDGRADGAEVEPGQVGERLDPRGLAAHLDVALEVRVLALEGM